LAALTKALESSKEKNEKARLTADAGAVEK